MELYARGGRWQTDAERGAKEEREEGGEDRADRQRWEGGRGDGGLGSSISPTPCEVTLDLLFLPRRQVPRH